MNSDEKRTLSCMPKFFEYKYLYHNFILLINTGDKTSFPLSLTSQLIFIGKIFCNFRLFFLWHYLSLLWLFTLSLYLCLTFDIFSISPPTLPSPAICLFFCYNSQPRCLPERCGSFGQSQFTCRLTSAGPPSHPTSQTPYEYGFFVLSVLLVNLLLFYAINPRLWKPLWRT